MESQFENMTAALAGWTNFAYENILTRDTGLQVGLIIAVAIISYYLRKIIVRTIYELGRNHRDKIVKYQAQISQFKIVLLPLLAAGLLWATQIILTINDRENDLIRIVSILLFAWAVIRFISIFIASPRFARSFVIFSWLTAALAILGWLEPVMTGVDSVGFSVGEVRVSVLSVFKAIFMLAVFFWVAHYISTFLQNQINQTTALSSSLRVLISKIVQFTLMGLAVLLALGSVGIDLTAFAVFTGALGVGVGFGLQKIISNFISGIILLLDKSLKPGDVIEVETGNGITYGWIEKLGLRYTSVTTRDGTETLIPNETFITNPVTNWSFSNSRVRRKLPIGVSYNTDVEKAMKLCIEAAKSVERIIDYPAPVCQLRGFGDSAVDLELRFWIGDPTGGVKNVESEVNLKIWKAFKANNIEIPFPQRDLHLISADGQPIRFQMVPPDERPREDPSNEDAEPDEPERGKTPPPANANAGTVADKKPQPQKKDPA